MTSRTLPPTYSSTVRIGVVILPQFQWAQARARWQSVEDRGFASAWTYDHLAWRTLADEPWYATVPTLTAAALATSRISLGTWVTSPNFRHPVTLAKELLTLDDISSGRIIAGIGAGGMGWDASVLGQAELTPRQRVDRLGEFVTLTDRLLTDGETSWQGDWFTAERARMHPAGARSRIPFLVAANGPRSMRIAAAADGWITTGPAVDPDTPDALARWWEAVAGLLERFRTTARAAGRDPDTLTTMVSLDSAPVFSLRDLDTFADAAGRARDLGFTDAIVHWPRPEGIYAGDERMLDRVAELLVDGAYH